MDEAKLLAILRAAPNTVAICGGYTEVMRVVGRSLA